MQTLLPTGLPRLVVGVEILSTLSAHEVTWLWQTLASGGASKYSARCEGGGGDMVLGLGGAVGRSRDPPAGTLSDICAGHHVPQGRQLNALRTTGTVLVQQQLDDASAASLLYFCLPTGLSWFSSSFSLCQLNYISFMVCLGRKCLLPS